MYVIIKLLKNCVLSLLLFLLLMLAAASLLTFTSVSSSFSPAVSIVILALSCMAMGFLVGSLFGKRGLLIGMASAFLLEVLIITVIMMIFSIEIATYDFGIKHIFPILAGAIGGVIGISFKK